MRDKTFLIMAGGTGGHVFPALAVAHALMAQRDKVVWLGSKGGMEETVIEKENIPFFGINIKGVRGKGFFDQLLAPFKVVSAVLQALSVLRKVKPNVVLGMGGFASGPGGMAARILGIPLVIHEQNSVAGMTNKILASFATTVMTAFPNAFSPKVNCKLVGNPLRADIAKLYYERGPETKDQSVNLLILGGSLGAQSLNQVVPQALCLLEESIRPSVWHQTGKNKANEVTVAYQNYKADVEVSEFIEDMANAYTWADFVICRAGALTISELCVAGLGSVLIPYPYAVDDHQTKNADFLVKGGAAWLLAQNEMTPQVLAEVLQPLLVKRERMNILSHAAYKLAQVDATESVANECRRVSYA